MWWIDSSLLWTFILGTELILMKRWHFVISLIACLTCKFTFIFMYELMLVKTKIFFKFLLHVSHTNLRSPLWMSWCRLDIFYFILYFCTQFINICVRVNYIFFIFCFLLSFLSALLTNIRLIGQTNTIGFIINHWFDEIKNIYLKLHIKKPYRKYLI